MFPLIISPTNNIDNILSVIFSKKHLTSVNRVPGTSLDYGETETATPVPAPGTQYDLQTALPPRGCVLGSTSTKCCERDGYDSGEGGQHKEEVVACV